MNTYQIVQALELDLVAKKKFCGIERFPCEFVASTAPHDKPGKHWVALYFSSEQKGQFFNSYGKPPDYYNETFKHYLDDHVVDWDFNRREMQSVWTNVCGKYCLFYLS